MRDIASTVVEWVADRRRFAIARVMSTWGSAPRRPGSTMAITADLEVAGSVSGGCIEGEVIDAAQKTISGGRRSILEFGVSDETAWSAGLSCGGRVTILLELFPAFSPDPEMHHVGNQLVDVLTESRPVVWVSSLAPDGAGHALLDAEGNVIANSGIVEEEVSVLATEMYRTRATGLLETGEGKYFAHVMPPRSTLLIIGATDIATHLVRFARDLDFETLVIDPREVFASEARFSPPPDRLIARWPQEVLPDLVVNDEAYAVLLTHDPKIDDPALHFILGSNAAYVGALGSSRTHARRRSRLEAAGLSAEQLDRIRGPVGLDIGAASPAEIALSVLAEVVQARNRRT